VAAALMLGIGGGALASAAVGSVAVVALLVGCFTLAWAAVQKQRLEMQSSAQPAAWEIALFWASWVAIAVVGAIIFWRTAISA